MQTCPLMCAFTLGCKGFPHIPCEIRIIIWANNKKKETEEISCSVCNTKFIVGRQFDYNNHFRCLSCVGHPEVYL